MEGLRVYGELRVVVMSSPTSEHCRLGWLMGFQYQIVGDKRRNRTAQRGVCDTLICEIEEAESFVGEVCGWTKL